MSYKYQDNLPSNSSMQEGNRNTRKEQAKDAEIDKFAILFSPSTPRASPTFDFATDIPSTKPGTYMPGPNRRSLSSDSDEFGSFVSVPVSEDPLAMGLGFDAISPQRAMTSVPPTSFDLRFFDQFGQNAIKASEKNRKSVLEELLLHEDDPLYWLKEESGFGDDNKMNQHRHDFATTEQKDTEESLIDLDSDFFSPSASFSKADSISSTLTRPQSRSSHPSHALTRSPTLTSPTTVAPPLAYTSAESPLTGHPPSEITDESNSTINSSSATDDNPSHPYQSISSLPSRWMSSFLPSSRPIPSARPTLESIFAHSDSSPPSLRSIPPSGPQVQTAATPNTNTTNLPQPKFVPVSFQISHETAFAPSSITHSSSPFASHVFVPPTGAPGFRGEQYDWDKGFSRELEQELKVKTSSAAQNRGISGKENGGVVPTQGQDRKSNNLSLAKPDTGHDAQKARAVAELIEKKVGSVEMKGRRVTTSPVLEQQLADMVRSYFPALARLPKSWNLLYSLDQHGISLNTLYSRCEAQLQVRPGAPKPAGALVVVKDAGNALFGVWLGEGIQMCRGKGYYGSGESFMWRYVGGKLEIFKWTGKNDYVALCEPNFISFGGGDGHYGLYLDESLYEGSSAPCPTFGNPPLCTPGHRKANTVEFECVGLEVWGIGP